MENGGSGGQTSEWGGVDDGNTRTDSHGHPVNSEQRKVDTAGSGQREWTEWTGSGEYWSVSITASSDCDDLMTR